MTPMNRQPSSQRCHRKFPIFSAKVANVLKAAQSYASEQGLEWDKLSIERKQKMLSMAGLAARLGKDLDADDHDIWKRQAKELGWVEQSLMGPEIDPGLDRQQRLDQAWRFVARHLEKEFETAAVIDHQKNSEPMPREGS
ncbi:hypothetical protein QQM41_13680 (plasmid) [Acetobacter sp. AC2005]|uniref:hypothetical protein n=1 Tax=Acetobacter sp. AC2005 TaxID=3134142 RepID=UPI0030D147AD